MALVFDDEVAPALAPSGQLVFDDEPDPKPGPADGFFGQVWQKLATGTRQAFAGAETTLGAITGADSLTSGGLWDLATADRRAAAERTPADLAFESEMAQNAAEFNAAPGPLAKAREFVDYAGIAVRNPSAAIQMGAQSAPNALISIPAALAGRALGAAAGVAAGVETGPGLIATGLAGAAAGDAGANILMEAGPAIYQQVLQATEGKAQDWTPDQFAAFLQNNPDLVTKGLKSGLVRGSVIGLVDVAGMGVAGRVMGRGAAAASRPALLARGAAATGIETAAEGGGEALAGLADTGQVDSAAVAQEMIGGTLTGVPTALAGKALSTARGASAEGRLVFDDEVPTPTGEPLNLAQIAARGGQIDPTEIPPAPAPSEAATPRDTAPIPTAPPIQRAPTPEIQPPDASISAPANGAAAPNASAPTPLPVLDLRPEPGPILAPAQPGLPADSPTADDATLRDTAPPSATSPQEQSASRAGLAPEAIATPATPPALPPTSPSQAQAPAQPRPEAERVKMSKPGVGEQVNLWRAIADDPNAFQLGPEPRVKTPTEIAKAYSNPQHQLEVTEVEPSQDRIAKEWDIRLNTGGTAKMMRGTDGTVWLNTAALESNREIAGGGAPVYQFAATYAHNNGLKFRADPAGLSKVAKLRRIDQMVSSALRHGTTAHLDPTAMQDDGSVEMSSWIPGNNDQNLGALLRLQAENVNQAAKDRGINLDDLTLDPETNTIRHDPTGQTLTQGDFKSLLGRFEPASSGVGETTLLRALITRSQMGAQRSGRGGAWHDNLLSLLSRGGATGRSDQRLPGALRRDSSNPPAGRPSTAPRVAGNVQAPAGRVASDSEVFRAINPSRKQLLYSHPAGTPGRLTADQSARRWNAAQTALDRLERVAPELAGRVRLVTNRTKLRASDFHPEDWSSLATSEGFFDPQTADIVIMTDQVEVRRGETTLQAIQRVALHEAIGHSGLQALRQNANPALVKRWNGLMESIESDPVISAEIAAIGEQSGYEHLSNDPDGLVEEWFARQVETFTEADLNQMPVTTPLGRLWLWLKDSLVWISRGFDKSVWTQAEVRELMQLSRQALRDGGPRGVSGERVKQSNPLHAGDVPNWLRRPLRMPANAPFRVQALGLRAMLKGSPLPNALVPAAMRSERDISALRQSAAQIAQDLTSAIDSYVARTNGTQEATHNLVAQAMETPALLAALPDPVLRERTRRARNLLDDLSAGVAQAAGGELGNAILQNRGHWMRRSYACFDEASNWTFDNLTTAAARGQAINGVNAATILSQARAYITTNVTAQRRASNQPAPTPGEIEAIMRDLTDRKVWQRSMLGNMTGSGVSKDVTSLMHRAAYHPDVMTWMRAQGLTEWDYMTVSAQAAIGGQWQGRPAGALLAAARAYLEARHPNASVAERNDMLRMQDIPAPLRALMGEERNPIKRFTASASFQAQYLARHEQQVAMRNIGLRMGLFSRTRTGVFTEELGDGRERNGFQLPVQQTTPNGQTITTNETIYTTPELLAALGTTRGGTNPADVGFRIVDAIRFIGSEAKLNKVALNPDSWGVNLLGNVIGLVQSGDLVSLTPWRNVQRAIELHRSGNAKSGAMLNAAEEAALDLRRNFLARATAAGVANSGLEMSDIEATLDNRITQFIEMSDRWDVASGGVRGAILGNGLGRPFGAVGQGIGATIGAAIGAKIGGKAIRGAQRKIAEWTTGNPDRFAKLAALYSNYDAHLAAGMPEQDAFTLAAEKTLNTLPDYSKLPAMMRELSRLGLMGSFIGFQYEVYRNAYWNARYATQELRSGNAALQARGVRRLLGLSGVLGLAGAGFSGIIRGMFGAGVEDEKDEAYRRALGAEHERFGTLAYTKLDAEGASFFNTSYLLPQVTLFEVMNAGMEGRDLGESMKNIGKQLTDQFVSGSVHLDPFIAAWTNQRPIGGKVSFEDGPKGLAERIAYFLYVTAEPGALNKEDRLVRAVQGRARYGRQFSLEEEMKRFLGVRQNTYTHEERIESRLFRFKDEYNDARSLARTAYRQGDPNAAAALARANERIVRLQADFDQFEADLMTIGVPKNTIIKIQKAVGGVRFAPLVNGLDGPESITAKSKRAYPGEVALPSAEPSRMGLPPRK
jgi:hypothetical protein